ncbi:MAG: hypothetical protein AAGB31_10655 [Bdellovibrio sp.]
MVHNLKLAVAMTTVLFSLVAGAQSAQSSLRSLSCVGKNGAVVELLKDSSIVRIKLDDYERDFETTRQILIYQNGDKALIRLPLGLVGAPQTYNRDIYLESLPGKGQEQKVMALIGGAVHGTVAFPSAPSPVLAPVGFKPITLLECKISVQ